MAAAYSVALVGFSQSESSTFESFFRLASRRPPAYQVQDEVIGVQILIVNADNLQAVLLVRDAELPGRVLLVGSSDSGTGWPLHRKPVKLVALLAALDEIVGARRGSASPPRRVATPSMVAQADRSFQVSQLQGLDVSMQLASGHTHTPGPDYPPSLLPGAGADRSFSMTVPYGAEDAPALVPAVKRRSRSADTEFPLTRPMQREAPAAAAPAAAPVSAPPPPPARAKPAAQTGVVRMTDFGGLDDLPLPTPAPARATRAPRSRIASDKANVPEVARGDMLLVAESLVEGRILLKRFRRYGLNVDWSREAAQALVMLKAHPYRLVVVDRLKGDPDGYHVCRTAKQTKGPKGAPVVIMFAPTAGSMDRMKAGLAGSDAYLSRSVGEGELYKVLAHHRLVNLDAFAPTNVGF
ncbi:response regulator [Hydrogenophaga sp. BPS33]|uniref:response regulator n=1 Tax=Hydrogenophaga sp. BPS33 TaxID=2651974 RepID=UPI00131FCB35|nr:hypothetical protein [Hydrogenophaga sp. BPS33]QHE83666.1 response regulator transcription factor [Hydrogenophaga sp. BPS33]